MFLDHSGRYSTIARSSSLGFSGLTAAQVHLVRPFRAAPLLERPGGPPDVFDNTALANTDIYLILAEVPGIARVIIKIV